MSDFEGQVGISDDLSIPVSSTVYRGGAAMAMGLGVLLLLVAIGLAAFYFYQGGNQTALPSAVPVPRNPVLEAYCQDCGTGVYRPETGTCSCRPAFTGPNCNVERHAPTYFDLGSPAGHAPLVTLPLAAPIINSLSFGNNSCTQACDGNPLCVAVEYTTGGPCHSQPTCALLASVEVPRSAFLVRSDEEQSKLYAKDPTKVVFANRVLLAAGVASFPLNYPKVFSSPGYAQHLLSRVFHVDFFPEVAVAPQDYVGVYSLAPFTMEQIPSLAGKPNVFFVIGNPFLPESWRGRRIFVAYAPKSTVPI